jgi:hypothetical protein
VPAERLGNLIGLIECLTRHVSPSGLTPGDSSGDVNMNMDMWNGLIGGGPVVLPDGNALRVIGISNRRGSANRGIHQVCRFGSGEIEHRHPVFDGYRQNVPQAALLNRHEERREGAVFKYGIPTLAGQVGAE